jgi:alpha-N-arabinofuranosidase
MAPTATLLHILIRAARQRRRRLAAMSRTFTILPWILLVAGSAHAADPVPFEARLQIDAKVDGPRIEPDIYGQFVEHLGRGVYEGIWVGEDSDIPNVRGIRSDVVAALKRIRVPLVRWPGGCFAENYHWRDGVGPRSQRPRGVNTAWGDEPESNHFGSDEFMDFIAQIGAKAFISVNVTTGTPGEAQAWMQYLTAPASSTAGKERGANGHPEPYRIPYIGIGNETWGCGGNMSASYYADLYRHYHAALRSFGTLIASDANSDQYNWTATLLERALMRHDTPSELAWIYGEPLIQWIGVHFYTFSGNDWGAKSAAVGFSASEWAGAMRRTSRTVELIDGHARLLDRVDPERRIGISFNEWGAWWKDAENPPSNLFQEGTLRDAVIAAFTLNQFHDRAERVRMANVAQMVNVLQSMILTRGREMLLTPTYHVFDLYQVHQGAKRLGVALETPDYVHDGSALPALSVSASRDADGRVHVSVVNLDPDRAARLELRVAGRGLAQVDGRVITAATMDARPRFGGPDPLAPRALQVVSIEDGMARIDIPAKSVSVLALR